MIKIGLPEETGWHSKLALITVGTEMGQVFPLVHPENPQNKLTSAGGMKELQAYCVQ